MQKLFTLMLPLLFLVSCDDSPVFPETPEISFVSISPGQATQFTSDEISITFHYQDGDGDLGYQGTEKINNLFITDTRAVFNSNPARTSSFAIPSLTPDTKKPSIQGEMTITLLTPPWEPSEEPLVFEIQLVDRSGKFSNVIKTNPITVNP